MFCFVFICFLLLLLFGWFVLYVWFYIRARGDYDVHISCAYLLRWLILHESLVFFFSPLFLFCFWFTHHHLLNLSLCLDSWINLLSLLEKNVLVSGTNFKVNCVFLFELYNWPTKLTYFIYIKLLLYLHRLGFVSSSLILFHHLFVVVVDDDVVILCI